MRHGPASLRESISRDRHLISNFFLDRETSSSHHLVNEIHYNQLRQVCCEEL